MCIFLIGYVPIECRFIILCNSTLQMDILVFCASVLQRQLRKMWGNFSGTLAERLSSFWFIFLFPFFLEIFIISTDSSISFICLSVNLKERSSEDFKVEDGKKTSWKLIEDKFWRYLIRTSYDIIVSCKCMKALIKLIKAFMQDGKYKYK